MAKRARRFSSFLDLGPVARFRARADSLWWRWIEPRLSPLFRWMRRLGLVSSPNRLVLSIGDEGATLVQVRGRDVVDAVLIGPETEGGIDTLRRYLAADRGAQVIVAMDVLEQMYREEQLPKVGRLDRGTIMRRRLDLAFPQDRLKAALPLPGGKALFAALPETEYMAQWVEFLESLDNPVTGPCLVPLEAVDIAADLGPSIVGEVRQVWRVLASDQATSGFRQIFESDGRLVVTRLTARPSSDMSPEATAQLIERELRSSISYLKRLGYAEQDRLDLIVLQSPEVCKAVAERDLPVTSLTTYTPHQAGLLLGLGVVAPEDSGFSDVLMAQWLARKSRPSVTLPSPAIRQKNQFDQLFRAGFGLAAALSLFTIYELASLTFDAIETTATSEVLSAQLVTERQAGESYARRLAAFDVKIEDVTLVATLGDELGHPSVDLAALLDAVTASLEDGMVVWKLAYLDNRLEPTETAPGRAPRQTHPGAKGAAELALSVRLSDDMTLPEQQLRSAKALREKLETALPGFEVEITHLPDTLHSQILAGIADQNATVAAAKSTVDYTIRKKS